MCQAGSVSSEPTLFLPGEQEAIQQTPVAGAPGTHTRKKLTSSPAVGGPPIATSTPAVKSAEKRHPEPVRTLP